MYSKCSLVVSPFCYVDSINLPLAFKKQFLGFEILIRMAVTIRSKPPSPLVIHILVYICLHVLERLFFCTAYLDFDSLSLSLYFDFLFAPITLCPPVLSAYMRLIIFYMAFFNLISLNQVFAQAMAKEEIKFYITHHSNTFINCSWLVLEIYYWRNYYKLYF